MPTAKINHFQVKWEKRNCKINLLIIALHVLSLLIIENDVTHLIKKNVNAGLFLKEKNDFLS